MKKTIFFFTLAIFVLTSCSDQYKAERAVKEYLKVYLNNPASYESVSFSKLKSYIPIVNIAFNNTADSILVNSKNINEKTSDSLLLQGANMIFDNQKKENILRKVISDSIAANKDHCRWMILHTFRGTNSYGAIITETKVFILSPDLSTVLSEE